MENGWHQKKSSKIHNCTGELINKAKETKTEERRVGGEERIFHLSIQKAKLGKPALLGDRVKFWVLWLYLFFAFCFMWARGIFSRLPLMRMSHGA